MFSFSFFASKTDLFLVSSFDYNFCFNFDFDSGHIQSQLDWCHSRRRRFEHLLLFYDVFVGREAVLGTVESWILTEAGERPKGNPFMGKAPVHVYLLFSFFAAAGEQRDIRGTKNQINKSTFTSSTFQCSTTILPSHFWMKWNDGTK